MTARGRVCQQLLRVDAQRRGLRPGRGHHDDVGGGQFGAERVESDGESHAALARVEVAEERRVGASGNRRTAGGVAPQPIPLRRFDFAYLRAGVDQQLPAVAARYPVTDLDDTQIVQRCRPALRHRSLNCTPPLPMRHATREAIYIITAKIAKPAQLLVFRCGSDDRPGNWPRRPAPVVGAADRRNRSR